jgi:hypothetical protein
VYEKHSHETTSKLKGHIIVGRLNGEDKKLVMTMNIFVPEKYYHELEKKKGRENVITINQVCNVRQRDNKHISGQRPEM